MIYVFTSLINGWDNLRSPAAPEAHNVRYVCFTNVPNLPRVYPWEYRPSYDVGVAPRTARVPKILPHLMLPEDAEYSIYHDANFQLRTDPNQIIGELLGPEQWAAHKHPGRKCIYDEARIVLRDCPLVTKELVNSQIAAYRAAGFPEYAGLWANGFIVRRHTPEVAELNETWWDLYSRGSERDQLAFPVARSKCQVPLRTISADVFSSPYIKNNPHAAWKDKEDNPDYWPERDRLRRRLARLAEVTETTGGVKYHEY